MNTRLVLVSPLVSSAVAVAFAFAAARCGEQPPVRCGMASGNAIARYQMTSGPTDVMPGACAALDMSGNALPVSGEAVGTEEYLPDQASDVTNTEPRSMAIEPLAIIYRIQDAELNQGGDGGLPVDAGFSSYPYTATNPQPKLPPDEPKSTNRPYAWGFFDSLYPDENGVCTATLNASDLVYPDIPAHTVTKYTYSPGSPPMVESVTQEPDQPETHIRYEWKNVRALIAGSSVGQQLFADLTITRDGCQAVYRVSLLSPQVTCAVTDADGNVIGHDPSICSSNAVVNSPMPTPQQLYGSGLPEGVPVDCVDLNAGVMGATPDWECLPTKWSP
jgi:hypothetical protein